MQLGLKTADYLVIQSMDNLHTGEQSLTRL